MANMVEEILGQIDPNDLAQRVGTDPETAMDAARTALPALLGGLDLEVQSGKADALAAAALQDHDTGLLSRVGNRVEVIDIQSNPLANVDPGDGQKILGHMFGDRLGTVEQRLGGASRADSSIFSRVLPILAPLVMSWLAGRMRGAGAGQSSGGGGGGGLDDMLGGGGLGGLLGGLLGGEKESTKQSMPDLGGLFDMFGGGGDEKGGGGLPDVGDLFGKGG